jgi:hypothetical protein
MTVVETATETRTTEEELVTSWRREQLVRAGYPEADALLLADLAYVDLHCATGLLLSGCPVDTALRILL